MKIKKLKTFYGFTLIELLVVIAIIGILAAIVYAPFQTARRKGRDAQKVVEMKNLYSSLLLYADSNNGYYPEGFYDLQQNQVDKLPSNTNKGTTTTDKPAYNPNKYNYTGYKVNGKVVGFHLYTHLETNSPALSGAAMCQGSAATSSATTNYCIVTPATVTESDQSTPEPSDGTSASDVKFRQASRTGGTGSDSDSVCAQDLTYCIYDLRG